MTGPVLPWRQAWHRAALGPHGFSRTDAGYPGDHVTTGVMVGDGLARAVAAMLDELDQRLGRPARLDLVDVGSGGAHLPTALLGLLDGPDGTRHRWRDRLATVAVDVRPAPADLDPRIQWRQGPAPRAVPRGVVGLVWVHEWLDDVPCDVVALDDGGIARLVLVDDAGRESLGAPVAGPGRDWLERWWPLDVAEAGDRAELGLTRDHAWRALTSSLRAGAVVAVDYQHALADRAARHWRAGTLVGYRRGQVVRPVPDGSCHLTAHVALDACAAASGPAVLLTQRDVLHDLGLAADPPDPASAVSGPRRYAAALGQAAALSRLSDPAGLGGFGWLRVDVG